MPFSIAYPRDTQEMVFDAHDAAFKFFGGCCVNGIYDNMTTAVDAVLSGKERKFNKAFLQMYSHHLVEPTACTRVAGWGHCIKVTLLSGYCEQMTNSHLILETLFPQWPKAILTEWRVQFPLVVTC